MQHLNQVLVNVWSAIREGGQVTEKKGYAVSARVRERVSGRARKRRKGREGEVGGVEVLCCAEVWCGGEVRKESERAGEGERARQSRKGDSNPRRR